MEIGRKLESGDLGLAHNRAWVSLFWCEYCEARRCRIRFDDLRALLRRLGFAERIKGSHHIFTREGVDEILNLQPRGSMAKPYQVKQVRRVLVQYKLAEEGQ